MDIMDNMELMSLGLGAWGALEVFGESEIGDRRGK